MKRLYKFKMIGGKWKALPFEGEPVEMGDFILYLTIVEAMKVLLELNRNLTGVSA